MSRSNNSSSSSRSKNKSKNNTNVSINRSKTTKENMNNIEKDKFQVKVKDGQTIEQMFEVDEAKLQSLIKKKVYGTYVKMKQNKNRRNSSYTIDNEKTDFEKSKNETNEKSNFYYVLKKKIVYYILLVLLLFQKKLKDFFPYFTWIEKNIHNINKPQFIKLHLKINPLSIQNIRESLTINGQKYSKLDENERKSINKMINETVLSFSDIVLSNKGIDVQDQSGLNHFNPQNDSVRFSVQYETENANKNTDRNNNTNGIYPSNVKKTPTDEQFVQMVFVTFLFCDKQIKQLIEAQDLYNKTTTRSNKHKTLHDVDFDEIGYETEEDDKDNDTDNDKEDIETETETETSDVETYSEDTSDVKTYSGNTSELEAKKERRHKGEKSKTEKIWRLVKKLLSLIEQIKKDGIKRFLNMERTTSTTYTKLDAKKHDKLEELKSITMSGEITIKPLKEKPIVTQDVEGVRIIKYTEITERENATKLASPMATTMATSVFTTTSISERIQNLKKLSGVEADKDLSKKNHLKDTTKGTVEKLKEKKEEKEEKYEEKEKKEIKEKKEKDKDKEQEKDKDKEQEKWETKQEDYEAQKEKEKETEKNATQLKLLKSIKSFDHIKSSKSLKYKQFKSFRTMKSGEDEKENLEEPIEKDQVYIDLLRNIEKMRTINITKTNIKHQIKTAYKKLVFYNNQKQVVCIYEGFLKNNLFHGKGKLTDKYSNLIYEGDWFEGERNGKGKLLFKYFNIWYLYEGEFLNDQIIDKGIISLIDKDYVSKLNEKEINKLCPLLMKLNFSSSKKYNFMLKTRSFSNSLLKKMEAVVKNSTNAKSANAMNNVDLWPSDIFDIYVPHIRKWNICSYYCTTNIELVKQNIEKFEPVIENMRNLIGYPLFDIVIQGNSKSITDTETNEMNKEKEEEEEEEKKKKEEEKKEKEEEKEDEEEKKENKKVVDKETKRNVLNTSEEEQEQQTQKKKTMVEAQPKEICLTYGDYKMDRLRKLFYDHLKSANEQKLYFPLISKSVGLTKIIYADKSEYFGAINEKGQPHTTEEYPKAFFNSDKFYYEGEMKNHVPHGYGVFKTKGEYKNCYIGFWKNGYREGKGNLTLKNKKYVIQADFLKDKLHNNIIIEIKDGKLTRIDITKTGSNSQKIKVFFRNGYIFYGYFNNAYIKNGIGILIDNNNRILYHGYYRDDIIDDYCYILRHDDNKIYSGNLKNGKKHGFGKLYHEEILNFDKNQSFNVTSSNADNLARALASYDGIEINSDVSFSIPFDSFHVIYVGYWNNNSCNHFGIYNLKRGFYKGELNDSRKEGLGVYIYKENKSYKKKNRYISSYFKNDHIYQMGKYYNEYDKMKVYHFENNRITVPKENAVNTCFKRQKLQNERLLTDRFFVDEEIDSYINMTIQGLLKEIVRDVQDTSTSFIYYLHKPLELDLDYFLHG